MCCAQMLPRGVAASAMAWRGSQKLYRDYMEIFHGGFREHVRREQIKWLRDRHQCGYGHDCIANAYTLRMAALGDGGARLAICTTSIAAESRGIDCTAPIS